MGYELKTVYHPQTFTPYEMSTFGPAEPVNPGATDPQAMPGWSYGSTLTPEEVAAGTYAAGRGQWGSYNVSPEQRKQGPVAWSDGKMRGPGISLSPLIPGSSPTGSVSPVTESPVRGPDYIPGGPNDTWDPDDKTGPDYIPGGPNDTWDPSDYSGGPDVTNGTSNESPVSWDPSYGGNG